MFLRQRWHSVSCSKITRTRQIQGSRGIIKWALLEAFLKAQAEVNIWRAQGEQNQLVSSRSGQPVEVGDQMVLSRETMITREEAEQMLREKAPAISRCQKQDQQRKEQTAAVSSSAVAHNNNNNNNKDSLTASSAGSTTPHNIFWDLLDDNEPLSANSDDDATQPVFFETVPHASTSAHHL